MCPPAKVVASAHAQAWYATVRDSHPGGSDLLAVVGCWSHNREMSCMRDDTITLTLKRSGQATVTVDRAKYEAAKAKGALDAFLDTYVSDIEHATKVVEPDGTEFDPYQ